MIIIQLIVVAAAVGLVFFVLSGRQTHAARAWKKLALCFLAVAMVVAVLFPETTNRAAHFVGVGRGADLLLYLLTLAFIGYALNNYIHQQREKDAVLRLARKLALLEALNRYDIHNSRR